MNPLRLALPALLLPVVTLGAPAVAADELCFGQTPTVVGAPDQDVTGTAGPGVILATNARDVRGLGGDDSICVVGRVGTVTAGDGDDRVETLRTESSRLVRLGNGADTFVGGASRDKVNTGDAGEVEAGLPMSTDDVSTGDGNDIVITGGGREVTEVNSDRIVLGRNFDQVLVLGSWVPSVDGGVGGDSLRISSPAGGDWVLDGPARVASRDGVAMGPMTSISKWNVTGLRWDHLTITGGDERNELELGDRTGRVTNDGPIDVHLGGGYDTVLRARSQDVGSLDGGPGFDSLSLEAAQTTNRRTSLRLDLAQGVSRLTGRSPLLVPGWERVYVSEADRSTFIGDARANQLIVFGCDNTIRGGGGGDALDAYPGDGGCLGLRPAVRGVDIDGGPGNDTIGGTYFRDRLVGGPGYDVIRGANGGDHCVAEVEKDCGH